MYKIISLILVMQSLTACGGSQQFTSGFDEPTELLVRSEVLVGMTIQVGDDLPLTISKKHLSSNKMAIIGARTNSEKLQFMIFDLVPGDHRVRVMNGDRKVFDKKIYLSEGQTRVVRINK